MTKPARGANMRWPGFLLAVLLAALVTVFGAGTASAATATAAQTSVGAHTPTAQVLVETDGGIGAGQRLDKDRPTYDFVLATGVAAKAAPELASGMERTGSALAKSDPFHRSVSWVVDNPAAQRFGIKGGDGVSRELYQLPGEVNGKSGVFEWIIDRAGTNPLINHQRFIPGGSVTGFPNQVAP